MTFLSMWSGSPSHLTAFLSFSVLVLLVRVVLKRRVTRIPLPPGPKTSWFGQVKLPKAYQWRTYADWKHIYGDLIYVRVLGNPILVLNSAEVIHDLFEKRGTIYSSRPVRTMVSELMGFKWLFSVMPYGTWWKQHRAQFQHYFNQNNPAMRPVVVNEVHVLLRNLTQTPEKLFHHARRTGAAIPMMLAYGHQIAPQGDIYVTIADTALRSLAKAGIYGTYLVDYCSFLKHTPMWMPGATFKRQAYEWRQSVEAMVNRPFDMVEQRMAAGSAVTCFVASELERLSGAESNQDEIEVAKNVAASAYAGGADTVVSTILSFFLTAMVYPEVQAKAQAELDRVIGRDRLPTLEDRGDLPYIDCMVWECVRWNPVTPIGIARRVMEDDEYRGYRIPKGTTVLPNVWAILHDERAYPNPLKFDPDRFADEDQNRNLGVNELPLAAFGFGRRACPGRWLALDIVWLTIATTLAAFKVSKPLDAQGQPIEPDTEFTPTLLSGPKPFQCCVVPRSDVALALVLQTEETH